jgi:hypothetical protein
MSDIKLFRIIDGSVAQLAGTSVAVEKSLQHLIEKHLENLLGVRFLASEHSTGKTHGGRIDTLGVDENGYPVIIEYKRSLNENVINQGLYYLDWLMDHKAEFKLLVLERFGKETANSIEWSSPRLLCIAGDFTKYDEHAVQQINRNIELIRYRKYGDELLLFELVNVPMSQVVEGSTSFDGSTTFKPKVAYKTVTEYLAQAKQEQRDRYEALRAFLLALGDDVQVNTLKYYFAFKEFGRSARNSKALGSVIPLSMEIIHSFRMTFHCDISESNSSTARREPLSVAYATAVSTRSYAAAVAVFKSPRLISPAFELVCTYKS